FKNEEGRFRSGWIIAFALVMVLLGQLMFAMPGYTFISLIETARGNEAEIAHKVTTTPLYIVVTQGLAGCRGIAAPLLVFRGLNKKNPNKLGCQRLVKDYFTWLVLGAVAISLIFFVLLITDNITLQNDLSSPNLSINLALFFILYL